MKNEILNFLKSKPKQTFSRQDIARHFDVPASKKSELRILLKEMAQEQLILRYRGSRYGTIEGLNTIKGRLKLHYEGYGFVIPEEAGQTDVFIPAKYRGLALPDDVVLVAPMEPKEGGRREGRILQIVSRGRSQWIGVLEQWGREHVVVCRDFSFDIDILVEGSLMGAKVEQMVVVAVTQYADDQSPMKGKIVEVLGWEMEEETLEAGIMVKHSIPRVFPQKVLDAAAELQEGKLEGHRVDLREKCFVTIDGRYARDFDDAVYIEKNKENFILYVSIADVAHYVEAGSILDVEAYARSTSTYFPDFVVPMLPEKLSNELCSLRPGEDKMTLTCQMEFNDLGEMLSAQYYESCIHSHHRGIYEEVQEFLDKKSQQKLEKDVSKTLQTLEQLAHLLITQRKLRGGLDFDLPEAEVIYNEEGEITSISKATRVFSHRLIEEMMISANVAVASLFMANHVPAPYRVHDAPDGMKIDEFVTFAKGLGIKIPMTQPRKPKQMAEVLKRLSGHPMEGFLHQMFLRSMKIARYDVENIGHFGLNLENYTHFTSPIRRYPDLLVHRQLKAMIARDAQGMVKYKFNQKSSAGHKKKDQWKGKPKIYSTAELATMANHCSLREQDSTQAEREMLDLKRMVFMQDHLGEVFHGIVKRITKFGVFVELCPYFVDGLLHVRDLDGYYEFDESQMVLRMSRQRGREEKVIHLGDPMTVKVADLSYEKSQIILEPYKDQKIKKVAQKSKKGRKTSR